ncbi:hypothetical protein LX36DRAFT_222769 [Colletotrichum falcatum]|nr:hypothetical protein LX36DRAFT_222769 [Colletotrichum falcatum]
MRSALGIGEPPVLSLVISRHHSGNGPSAEGDKESGASSSLGRHREARKAVSVITIASIRRAKIPNPVTPRPERFDWIVAIKYRAITCNCVEIGPWVPFLDRTLQVGCIHAVPSASSTAPYGQITAVRQSRGVRRAVFAEVWFDATGCLATTCYSSPSSPSRDDDATLIFECSAGKRLEVQYTSKENPSRNPERYRKGSVKPSATGPQPQLVLLICGPATQVPAATGVVARARRRYYGCFSRE